MSALQIGLGYPETFGMAFALSPLLRDPPIAAFVAKLWRSRRGGPRVLIDLDDDPTGHADFARLEALAGTDPEVAIVQTPGSRHAIASWAERVVPALTTLFAKQCPD